MWRQLGIDGILRNAGLSQRACTLSEVMTLNRLICPLSEHAMPDWMRRTALADIVEFDFDELDEIGSIGCSTSSIRIAHRD